MSELHTFVAIPFLLAFALSVKRFYFRDGCASIFRGSFLTAAGSMVLALTYILLGAMRSVPPYGTLGFGIVGLLVLGIAVWQAFQL